MQRAVFLVAALVAPVCSVRPHSVEVRQTDHNAGFSLVPTFRNKTEAMKAQSVAELQAGTQDANLSSQDALRVSGKLWQAQDGYLYSQENKDHDTAINETLESKPKKKTETRKVKKRDPAGRKKKVKKMVKKPKQEAEEEEQEEEIEVEEDEEIEVEEEVEVEEEETDEESRKAKTKAQKDAKKAKEKAKPKARRKKMTEEEAEQQMEPAHRAKHDTWKKEITSLECKKAADKLELCEGDMVPLGVLTTPVNGACAGWTQYQGKAKGCKDRCYYMEEFQEQDMCKPAMFEELGGKVKECKCPPISEDDEENSGTVRSGFSALLLILGGMMLHLF